MIRTPLQRVQAVIWSIHITKPPAIFQPPLEGLCIGITGTEAVAAKQLKALQTLGARGLWILRSDIKALPPEPALRALEKDPQ